MITATAEAGALPRPPAQLAGARAIVWRPPPTTRGPDGDRHAARVVVLMPYERGTRYWLRQVCGTGTRPEWDRQRRCWLVARAHFRAVVDAVAERYGAVAVCVDVTVLRPCGPWCRDAVGDECDCSGLGDNHAGGQWAAGWVPIADGWVIRNERMRRWYRAGTS